MKEDASSYAGRLVRWTARLRDWPTATRLGLGVGALAVLLGAALGVAAHLAAGRGSALLTVAALATLGAVAIAFTVQALVRGLIQPIDALRRATELVGRLSPARDRFGNTGPASGPPLAERPSPERNSLEPPGDEIGQLAIAFHRMVELLRDNNERLATILNTAAIGIINIDETGAIESFNATAERIFGFREREVLGRDFQTLIGGDERPAGLSGSCEVVGRRRDGETFPMSMALTPARYGDRLTYTIILRDISERRRAQREKEELAAQLRHSQKLELIGTLAGGIAHDFANILTPMMAYTEMVMEDLPPSSVDRAYLDRVIKGGQRARNLVQQILTFSGQAEEARAPIRVAEVVGEALRLVRALVPATVRIEEHIEDRGEDDGENGEAEVVMADATQLHQVIMNLCINAHHAMRGTAGVLRVTLDTVDPRAGGARALPAGLPRARYVRLQVRDTGCGMDAATRERVFEPFFTTKDRGEGTGLGLSVVHGIVHSHGGEIRVESTPGEGSCFQVFLPVAAQDRPERAVAATGEPAGEESILFVDDEEEIALVAKRMLERLGYDVIVRTSSTEALDLFHRYHDRIDAVVTDQTMPELSGTELCARLREVRPDLPIVLVSGLGDGLTGDAAHRVGASAFLRKPFVARDLGLALRQVLDPPPSPPG